MEVHGFLRISGATSLLATMGLTPAFTLAAFVALGSGGGDFNEILADEEKSGGVTRPPAMMEAFRDGLLGGWSMHHQFGLSILIVRGRTMSRF